MKRRLFKFILIPVLLLLAVGFLFFTILLPLYIEKNILPSLGDQFFTSVNGKVLRIGINKTSIGDLTIGDQENIALKIGSILAEYSFSSIKNKRIDQVRINGFSLNLEVSEGRVVIPGLNLEKIAATREKQKKSSDTSVINIDWLPDNFQVTDGFINIVYENKRFFVPFDLQLTRRKEPDTKSPNPYDLNLQIFPQGEKIIVTGSIDLKNNTGRFSLSADSLDIQSFAFLLDNGQKLPDTGQVSIKSNAEIKLRPFQLVSSDIDCELESLNLNSGSLAFGTTTGSEGPGTPLQLKMTGNGSQWNVTAHGSVVKPLAATISLHGKFLTENNSAKGDGNIAINFIDRTIALHSGKEPLIINANPEILADFTINGSSDAWQGDIKSRTGKKDIEISYSKNILSVESPSLQILGKGGPDNTRIEASLKIENIHTTGANAIKMILPMIDFQAFFNMEEIFSRENLVAGNFKLSVPGATIKKESLTVNGDMTLTGNMKPQQLRNIKFPQLAGEIIVSNAKVDEQKNNVTAESIYGRIPWQLSMKNHEATGKMQISDITWKKNKLGSFETEIRLNGDGYYFNGLFNHSLPGGLTTNFTGNAGIADSKYLADMTLHMDVSPFKAVHLGRFDSAMSDSYINGELGLYGKIRYDANSLKGNMTVMMQNGRFTNQGKKQTVNDISLSLHIPSLPVIRSAPAQKILFETASIGDLRFEKGKVVWQLESPDSIFIEEGVVRWVGGRVFTSGVRISPEIDELIVPIFCDRLILTEVLTQFGITGAAGEGTVSGRIPMHINRGKIRFEDGFLYSSPGQGGSIKIAAFDLLSAGIPKNSPQFAQVDFAAEALKNFQYNWVRLLLNSEGEDMFMQMQMDGKPLQSLPFTYDSRTGLLQRADNTKKGIHQPIRLDVNFRLPLNRFLGYSGKIQDIMKNLQ